MSFISDWEVISFDDVKDYVEKNGVENIKEFFKNKLEDWKGVEVNIGITGDSGTGKSSFINAIRGLCDDDQKAAAVGVTETTKELTAYDHPTNPKINFWDLPGMGTPRYPVETYSEQVQLEKYHAFVIFTANRFTENDLILAKKIKSIDKKFFFVRTKIDENVRAEKRKQSFNENATLKKIRSDCAENLHDLLSNKQDIFLISNHHPEKWDFARLTQAILDALPTIQQESLTLSLKSFSAEIIKRKAEVLKGRIWKVAALSASVAVVPLPGLSLSTDIALLLLETSFYRSQLGLPEEGSKIFLKLNFLTQEKVRNRCLATAAQVVTLLAPYAVESAVEESVRFIPVLGSVIAGGLSFTATYAALKKYLKDVEELAVLVMQEAAQNTLEENLRESQTLSFSELKSKVEDLEGRVWMVASAFATAALVLFPGVSIVTDIGLLLHETSVYRSQLGLPEKGSEKFLKLQKSTQEEVCKCYLTTATQAATLLAPYAIESAIEEGVRFIPFIGSIIAGSMSFAATYAALKHYLRDVEKAAELVFQDAAEFD